MAYWLMKSEPYKYSFDDLLRDRQEPWDGIRNYQAAIFMREMKVGDLAFFYHSNEGKEVVGIMTICRSHYPDPTDATGKFCLVDVSPVEKLPHPVTLKAIKANPNLANMRMLRQARLSISPVLESEWQEILKMSQNPSS